MRDKRSTPGQRLLAAAFWLLLWHLAASRLALPLLLPSPAAVLCRLGELAVTGAFWQTIAYSLLRILAGFGLGLVCGCLLALLAFFCRPVEALCRVPLGIIKSTPVASFIILALVWLPSPSLSLFISFLMVLPLVYENLFQGLCSADPQLLQMARVFRLSKGSVLRHIYWPAALPYFAAAVRSSLGFAWKSGIAGEVLAIPAGAIGTQLYNAKVYLETPDLFAWTAVIVLLSYLLEKGALLLLGRVSQRPGGPL